MSPMPEEENLQIGHCDNDVAMRPYLLFVIFCTAAQFRTWNCTQKSGWIHDKKGFTTNSGWQKLYNPHNAMYFVFSCKNNLGIALTFFGSTLLKQFFSHCLCKIVRQHRWLQIKSMHATPIWDNVIHNCMGTWDN